MGKLQDNYNMGDTIYQTESYVWDGKSRPNVNNYIQPWSKYANLQEANSLYKKNLHYNSAIRFAKTQLEAAMAQYKDDLAFWNERDERDYTDQASQVQRYEDAGFNLGYMYGNVDSGNSAVGYNQGDVTLTPNDTSNKSFEQSKVIIDAVYGALSAVTSIVKSGVDVKKLPYDIAESKSRGGYFSALHVNTQSRTEFQELVNSMRSYFQSHDFDGDSIENLGDSVQAAFESIGYKLQDQQFIDRFNWNQYSNQIYKLQSVPEGFKNIINMITDSDMPDWAKSTLSVLTYIFDVSIRNTSYSYKK